MTKRLRVALFTAAVAGGVGIGVALQDDDPPPGCWKRADGSICRFGRLYGPGQGGTKVCAPESGDVPYVCNVNAGQEPEDIAP